MNASPILNMLGKYLAVFTVPAMLCAIWAFNNDRYEQASLFILVVTLGAVVASVLIIATKGQKLSKAGLKEAAVFLLCAWATLILLGSIPFLLVSGQKPILAIFEAASCATTTGTSLVVSDTPLSASLIAWRGWLHLGGAMLSVSGVILAVSYLGRSGLSVQRVTAKDIGAPVRLETFMRVYWFVGLILICICAISLLLLMADGLGLRAAFILSVGAVTTGHVAEASSDVLAGTHIAYPLLCVVLVLASLSMFTLANALKRPLSFFHDIEAVGILTITFALVLAIALIIPGHDLSHAWGEAISILSTSGLFLPLDRAETLGLPVLVFFGLIGGATLSATGGMKFFRMRLLFARAGFEFSRLAQPHAVQTFKLTGVRRSVEAMMAVWVYLIGIACLAVGMGTILSIIGLDFEAAISVAVGAMTNSQALMQLAVDELPRNSWIELILTTGMIIGRLELLLLLTFSVRS